MLAGLFIGQVKCRWRHLTYCAVSLACVLVLTSVPVHAQRIDSMFFVTKKQNQNQVHYAANTVDCRWSGLAPVHAYWRMLQRAPEARQELDSGSEQEYFGYRVVSQTDRVLSIKLGAFERASRLAGLTIRIALSGDSAACRSTPTIEVDGTMITLSRMHADYSILGLNFVEFHGSDPAGRTVMKRIDAR